MKFFSPLFFFFSFVFIYSTARGAVSRNKCKPILKCSAAVAEEPKILWFRDPNFFERYCELVERSERLLVGRFRVHDRFDLWEGLSEIVRQRLRKKPIHVVLDRDNVVDSFLEVVRRFNMNLSVQLVSPNLDDSRNGKELVRLMRSLAIAKRKVLVLADFSASEFFNQYAPTQFNLPNFVTESFEP